MEFNNYLNGVKTMFLDDIELSGKEDLRESSLSRLYQHYKEHDSGTISAYRGERTKAENKENSKKLKNYLLSNGYSVTQIQGAYEETDEDGNKKLVKEMSYIVVDIKDKGSLKKVLVDAGRKFNQEAITFSEKGGDYYLIMCDSGEEIKLGKPMFGKDGEIISKINGRPFIFTECEDIDRHTYNDTLNNYNPLIVRKKLKDNYKDLYNIIVESLSEEKEKLYRNTDFKKAMNKVEKIKKDVTTNYDLDAKDDEDLAEELIYIADIILKAYDVLMDIRKKEISNQKSAVGSDMLYVLNRELEEFVKENIKDYLIDSLQFKDIANKLKYINEELPDYVERINKIVKMY